MASPVYHIPGYEFVRELGVGGMATVYLAIQSSLDRSVAIKIMRREGADDNFEKRFLLEGRTMAKLPHRNIVGVYDIVQNDSINYIAMEYLGGGTLSERMRQGLSLADAISIVVQIAGALQFAHDGGVIHRDLKPANVMFRDTHTPVLTDFGIARQKDAAATRLTQTGMMIGTPTYMSPEQAMGNDVDGRSDQYSLGILFYEMLTGAPPFSGDTPLNVVLAHINQPPPALPPAFAHFQPVLERMLAKDKENRYPDLTTFVRELKAMLTSSETLLARLQIDPSQSASEQLRALGFSESQINTGSRQAAGGVRVSAQLPSAHHSGPGVQMGPPIRRAPARPRWLVPAAAGAIVLGIALGLWAWLGGRDELDPSLRALVNTNLMVVDRLIDDGKLVSPPGDNANEKLQEVLQISSGLPEALQRQARIVSALREQAEAAVKSKNFPAAEIRVGEALGIVPDDPELTALRQRIASAKLGAERDARVAELLRKAEIARAANRLYGSEGEDTLSYLRQAIEVDPQNAGARDRLNALTTQALAGAATALKAGRLDESGQLLEAAATYFASEPAWQSLSTELEKAREEALRQSRIEGFLVQARNHVSAGRFAEPSGDNALQSLARLAELDPKNVAAAALRREIGVALQKMAKEAERNGDFVEAAARFDQALLAQPENAEYTAAKRAIEARLTASQSQLAAAINGARSAINGRRYLAPAGNNAREFIEAALKLDPGNADARALQASLPGLVRDAAAQLARDDRYDEALALLADAQKQYPDNTAFPVLSRSLSADQERARGAAQRQQRLTELQELFARGQLNPEISRSIVAQIGALLKLDPEDADALRYRKSLVADVARAIAAADSPARLALIEPVLEPIASQFGSSSADVKQLQDSLARAGEAIAVRERERLAAISGTLVLNAYPWADVESVVEQTSGRAVSLPRDRSTPLRLSLPAGTYRVTFKHPQAGKPVVLVAGVQAKKSQVANASFPTLTARDYLKRAGYEL